MTDDLHEIRTHKNPKQLSQKDHEYFASSLCPADKFDYPDVYPCSCEEDKLLYYANGFFASDKFVTKLAQLHRQQKMSVLEEKQKEYDTTSYGEYYSNFSYVKVKERREKKRFNSKYREAKQRQCLTVQERLWSNIESPEIILTRTLDNSPSLAYEKQIYENEQLHQGCSEQKKFRSASFDGNKLSSCFEKSKTKNQKASSKSKRNKERRKSMTNAKLHCFNRKSDEVRNEENSLNNRHKDNDGLHVPDGNNFHDLAAGGGSNNDFENKTDEKELDIDSGEEGGGGKPRTPQQSKEDMTTFILEGITSQKSHRSAAAATKRDDRSNIEDMLTKMSLKKGVGGRCWGSENGSGAYVNKLVVNKKDQHWTQKSSRFKFPHVTTHRQRKGGGGNHNNTREEGQVAKTESKLFTFPLPLL